MSNYEISKARKLKKLNFFRDRRWREGRGFMGRDRFGGMKNDRRRGVQRDGERVGGVESDRRESGVCLV